MIEDAIRDIAARSAQPENPGDYYEDGLLHCGKCHRKKQTRITLNGKEMIVGCICKCREDEIAADKKRMEDYNREQRIKRLRVTGIQDRNFVNYRFESATMTDNLKRCRRYVERWAAMLERNIGLVLWGNTGNGKTFSAACIANALIDQGVPVLMTSFPKILNSGYDKSEIISQMHNYPLLIIDDLGAERGTEYALETVFMTIDERVRSGLPLIVTTNLSLEEMRNPKDIDYQRIYERVLEMCVPIRYSGESMRGQIAKDKLATAKELFGKGGDAHGAE